MGEKKVPTFAFVHWVLFVHGLQISVTFVGVIFVGVIFVGDILNVF